MKGARQAGTELTPPPAGLRSRERNADQTDGAGQDETVASLPGAPSHEVLQARRSPRPHRARQTIAGRYSDSRARDAWSTSHLVDAASQAVTQCYGIVRSQSPLRGSSGFTPDSRLSSAQPDVV